MSKVEDYRKQLRELKDWIPFLRKESGLPGPRGNLELAHAAAREADSHRIETLLSIRPERAPENSANVFVVFCGVVALGVQVAGGDRGQLDRLREFASDPRWRIREAVATGLQYVGDADMRLLLRELRGWAAGNWYEKRAAAAALAEPRLLTDLGSAAAVLQLLDEITASMVGATDASSEAFKTLRQGLGYCWSVAIAAHPRAGMPHFEKWLSSTDPSVRWIARENLRKNRLIRMDARWVKACLTRLGPTPARPSSGTKATK